MKPKWQCCGSMTFWGGEIENVQLLCKAGFFKIITVHLLINPFTGHFFLYDDIFTLPSVNLIFLKFFGVKRSFNTLKNWPNFFLQHFLWYRYGDGTGTVTFQK
jgi:hypothetical protein